MTVDRQQIRRDAEGSIRYGSHLHPDLARHCLALLTELEQAERAIKQEADEKAGLYLRLANVPALVEALKRIEHYPFAFTSDDQSDLRSVKDLAHEALAAWDPE